MSDPYLTHVRSVCLALPEATEKVAWGGPTFRVRNRMFAMYHNNHHGDGRIALWLHAPAGAQAMLVEAAPERFFVPPYMGPSGWVGVHLDCTEGAELELHVRQAYAMVAPKKLLALLDGGQARLPN